MKFGPTSVRWRLTLWYALVLAVPLTLFSVGSRYVLAKVLTSRADFFLEEARGTFLAELNIELADLTPLKAVRAAMRDVRFRDITFFAYDIHNALLAASDDSGIVVRPTVTGLPPLVIDRARLPHLLGARINQPAMTWTATPNSDARVLIGVTSIRGQVLTIAAVQSRETIYATLSRLTLVSVIAIPVFLLIASIGGYMLSRRALAPVAMMSRQARASGATQLHERLPVQNPQDELGELATMVNELLQRLERSFEQQRRFVANASHELRTPIAIVRAESEVALSRESRVETEYRDALQVVHDASDRLSRIVNDLFLLARADAGNVPVRSEPLYLEEMVADVVRSMRSLASQRGICINMAPMVESPFVGDVELLGRMLLNLLDNAVKYSGRDTAVSVALARSNGDYRLSVADQGPGIPPDAQPHVFERFFRVDRARARADRTSTSGAGLGLAIVRLVAEAHGGHADLTRSDASGSEFTITLPAAAELEGVPVPVPEPV